MGNFVSFLLVVHTTNWTYAFLKKQMTVYLYVSWFGRKADNMEVGMQVHTWWRDDDILNVQFVTTIQYYLSKILDCHKLS